MTDPAGVSSTVERRRQKLLGRAGLAVLAILGAYFMVPIASPVHPEGFTASVASLGLHWWQDSLANLDLPQPLNVEFFGLTKLGWMILIGGITWATGISASGAMTLLDWAAFIPFTTGCVFLVRRWTDAPGWAACIILLLLPGVSETFFFFNDNVIAAAFAVSALCALYLENRLLGSALYGLLMAAAVLTRTDTILVGIAMPAIAFERARSRREGLTMLVVAGAAGAFVLLGTLAVFNATIFDIFKVAGTVASAWQRYASRFATVTTFLYYLGLPGLLLAILGAALTLIDRHWLASARLVLPPILVSALVWGKLWEVRQLLPLTPFFASLAAIGGMRLVKAPRTIGAAVIHACFLGLIATSLFGPITGRRFIDGPRVLTGRAWNIENWRSWQRDIKQDVALLGSLSSAPAGGTRIIIADFWTEDRLGHLALQESGYRISRTGPSSCLATADIFVRGNSRVILLRMHHFAPYWRIILPERLERWGLPCIKASGSSDIIFVASRARMHDLLGELEPNERFERKPADFSVLRAVHVSPTRLGILLAAYRRDAQRAVNDGERGGTLNDAIRLASRETDFGR